MPTTTTPEIQLVLDKSKDWFKKNIIDGHIKRTKKLAKASEFNINPFLAPYLSAYLTGEVTPEGIAKALIYSRALGPSINGSFGTHIQNFIPEVFGKAYGSAISGIDIEFVDKVDQRKKYAQLKLGPNTINHDDVITIHDHFKGIRNRSKTNAAGIQLHDLVVCVLYGTESELSAHYKSIRDNHNYTLLVGEDFWYHLTGDQQFFQKLVSAISETLAEVNASKEIEAVVSELAKTPEIQAMAGIAKTTQTPVTAPPAPPPTTP
jgi:hypothetical protein